MNSPYSFELAIVLGLFAVGGILFGHFEERTPKWRRVTKVLALSTLSVVISATAGRAWFFVMIGALLLAATIIHAWWLPRKGINGWTAEPRERYYALRGWKLDEPPRHRG